MLTPHVYCKGDPTNAIVVSIPHSGTRLPEDFCNPENVPLTGVDVALDELFSFLPELGVTTLVNPFSRFAADPNRPREKALLTRTAWGRELPPPADPEARLRAYYDPYHAALDTLLRDKLSVFHSVLLLDLHSFSTLPRGQMLRADCVLSDAEGASCQTPIRRAVRKALHDCGFPSVRNKGFTGGEILRAHSCPPRIQALQIELRTTTYFNRVPLRETPLPRDGQLFADAQARLYRFFEKLLQNGRILQASSGFTTAGASAYNKGTKPEEGGRHDPAEQPLPQLHA